MPHSEKPKRFPGESTEEIAIIAADVGIGELLVELLENQFRVSSFSGLTDFEKSVLTEQATLIPALILCDAKLRDGDGLEALKRVRKIDPTLPFILMVNQPEKQWIKAAFQEGVTDLLEKPFESFIFIDKFRGRIAQAKTYRAQNRMHELLLTQLLLTTTLANRLAEESGKAQKSPSKKLRYASHDEDQIRFGHARMNEEKILIEINRCRIEYLSLAERL